MVASPCEYGAPHGHKAFAEILLDMNAEKYGSYLINLWW